MNHDDQTMEVLERIEKYLDGNMTGSEKADFERQMDADSRLAADVRAYKAINFAIAGKDYLELKNDLVNAKKLIEDVRANVTVQYEAESAPSAAAAVQREESGVSVLERIMEFIFPSQPMMKLALAVAVVAVLLVPSYFFFFGGGASPERLFADNFQPYPDVISSTRGDSDEGSQGLLKAMQLYESKDYAAALPQFNEYLAANPAHAEATFYRGITNLQLGNMEQASSDLEHVMDNNRSLENQAKWYLAMLYLKSGQAREASDILKEIEEENGMYSDKAKIIRKKLND